MPQYVHVNACSQADLRWCCWSASLSTLMDLRMWQQLMAALDQLEADQVTFRSSPSHLLWNHFRCDAGDHLAPFKT